MPPVFSAPQVLAMEQAAARAWPASETADIAGWTWRFSGGGSRRANSVLPLTYSGGDPDAAIADVEARYRLHGLRCYFQVSSISAPADVDQRLAARGYALEEPCLLLAKAISSSPMPPDVDISETASAEWLAVYGETLDAARRATAPHQVVRAPVPRAFFLARRDGVAMASALGVLSPDGVVIVECVATRALSRRTGAAQKVMEALESWAGSQGAQISALQVITANAPARALYAGRGYVEAGRYHYRWKDL